MIKAGQIVTFRFPQTDLAAGKLRPALLIGKVPDYFNNWLICMITSKLKYQIVDFDEIISPTDADFVPSGLKTASLIRIGRLAVADVFLLKGYLGEIDAQRLNRIKEKLSHWLMTS
ncbi:MAG: type II toxin-antitoxin system PemK/MazF family toxin [Deltaproteobacteria bacterium]|nr:type II toxin-antitoxin system PemK/MazF family toxin [Deltaproteobacteria bacterium]